MTTLSSAIAFVAVARACGHQEAYLPGLAIRRISRPTPMEWCVVPAASWRLG
ncbi:hypothetical protein [Saccharopolyspora spinosa]|uniref:hypothetical protein n=1 Tax=Saccharopolyspora spinosa TaxID=60894 RepID=UPI003BA84B63